MSKALLKICVAEFIGTFALIFIGVGVIHHLGGLPGNSGLVGIALAHGLTIGIMASATGAISGGHLNPAVTFGFFVGGQLPASRVIPYWISQIAGATLAAVLCLKLVGLGGADVVAAGTPDLGPWVGFRKGVAIEAVLTFFLMFVIYGSAADPRAHKVGGLAIGFAVAADIFFGGPLTGAAMNPARTFGPALASGHWNNHLVYWVGPLLGAGAAGLVYGRFLIKPD